MGKRKAELYISIGSWVSLQIQKLFLISVYEWKKSILGGLSQVVFFIWNRCEGLESSCIRRI